MTEKVDSNKKTNFIMGELEYKKAIWTLALPSITSFLVLSMYVTIDRLMVANFVGGEGLAAIQYFQPSLSFLIAMLIAVGTGTKTLVSILYGKKEIEKSKEALASGFLITLILSLVTSFLIFFLGPFIPGWMGAESNIAALSGVYFFMFTFGIIPQSFVFFSESVFTAKGYTKSILVFTIISQVLNLSLDYLLMGVFDWGISGAAFATVFSMYVSFICYILYIIFVKKEFLINPFKYKFISQTTKKIIRLGIPSSIAQVIIAVKFILVTVLLSSFKDPSLIIVYSATMAILNTFFIPFFGLSSATIPMMGYNYGSKNYQRIKKVWKYKIKISFIYFALFIGLLWFFPQFFLNIFNAGNYKYSKWLPRIITMGLWVFPLIMAYGFLFQAIGNVKESLYLNMIRNVFVFVPTILIFRFFNDPIILLFAFPFSDFLGVIIVFIFAKTKYWRRLDKEFQDSWN